MRRAPAAIAAVLALPAAAGQPFTSSVFLVTHNSF
jgi:hypothetical protein